MGIIILGHRGMGPTSREFINQFLPARIIPENTLLAFQTAIDYGAQGIELDVYTTLDGVVVVARDDILDRNVDGLHSCWEAGEIPKLGKISEKTFAELQDDKYALGQGQHIPTLKSVIDLIINNNKNRATDKLKINVELQGGNLLTAQYAWDIIREYVTNKENNLELQDFVVNSFNMQQLIKFREAQANDGMQGIELMQGIYTEPLFGREKLLPGWVPVMLQDEKPLLDAHGLPIPKDNVDEIYLNKLICILKQYGICHLDIVSSDLRANLLHICAERQMHISMACNLIRARAEYDIWCKKTAAVVTDAELEQIQLQQLFMFAKQYPEQTFYYKSDSVQQTLAFLKFLELNDQDLAEVIVFSKAPRMAAESASHAPLTQLVQSKSGA